MEEWVLSRRTNLAILVFLVLLASIALAGRAIAGSEDSHPSPGKIESKVFLTLPPAPGDNLFGPGVEGPAFDRGGKNLYFVRNSAVLKLSMQDRQVTTVFSDPTGLFVGLKIHKDGRLFVAQVLGFTNAPTLGGKIFAINPDGSGKQDIVTQYRGGPAYPDDLVFGDDGSIYWTSLEGNLTDKRGRLFRTTGPAYSNLTTALLTGNLAFPNGISISPDNKRLWVDEMRENRLIFLDLGADGNLSPSPLGPPIAAERYFSGGEGPDSNCIDSAGNIYVAQHKAGLVHVVDPDGRLLAEVVMPAGFNGVTNCAIRPGTSTGFVTVGFYSGTPAIVTFKAVAPAPKLYSQQ
jgi:lactonase